MQATQEIEAHLPGFDNAETIVCINRRLSSFSRGRIRALGFGVFVNWLCPTPPQKKCESWRWEMRINLRWAVEISKNSIFYRSIQPFGVFFAPSTFPLPLSRSHGSRVGGPGVFKHHMIAFVDDVTNIWLCFFLFVFLFFVFFLLDTQPPPTDDAPGIPTPNLQVSIFGKIVGFWLY